MCLTKKAAYEIAYMYISLIIKLLSLKFSLFVFRENILKTAKALVEDTKNLVSGAASSQEKLAQAAQSSAKTITQLTDVVKLGAASIGPDDPETQVRAMEKVMRTDEKSNTGIYQHPLVLHLSGMHMCCCHSSPRRWC